MWSLLLLIVTLTLTATADSQEDPCQAGGALWEQGERRAALTLLEEALAAAPGDRDLRLCLAERQIEVHRYAGALDSLLPLAPGPEVRPMRARALWMLGRYEEALEFLDPARAEEALLRVRGLLRLGDTGASDAELARASVLIGPADPRVVLLEGKRLVREGRFEEAARTLEPLHEADPFDGEILFLLGQARVRSGKREEGLALLERHRTLAPLLDDLEFALRGVDLDPLHAPGHAQVGDIERAIGRLDSAEERYRRAWGLAEPEELSPIALRWARLLYEDRGTVEGALTCLDGALERVPDPRLRVRAGDYARDGGLVERARGYYRAALEARPDDKAILERLRGLDGR